MRLLLFLDKRKSKPPFRFFSPQVSDHSVIGNKLFLNTWLHKKIIVS